MASTGDTFDKIEERLKAADSQLVRALDARAEALKQLIELRQAEPDAYFALPRDVEVLSRTAEEARRFPKGSVKSVFREVLSACASMLAPVEVVYMGIEGGLGHTAARKHFGSAANLRPAANAEDAVAEVERKRASLGVLPWETSNDGAVTTTLNVLARSEVKLCAEISLTATYHLLSQSGEPSKIKTLYGTPSAIAASQRFILNQFGQAQVIDTLNGMRAAERAQQDPEAAAICTDVIAQLTDLEFVQRSVEDQVSHEIRYAVIGTTPPPRTGTDRTTLVLATHDSPGELLACLRPLAERGVSLTRVETRPARGLPWRFLILMELDGHITDRPVLSAVEEIRASNRHVRVLGSYPRPE